MSADCLSIPINSSENVSQLLESCRNMRINQQVRIADLCFHRYENDPNDENPKLDSQENDSVKMTTHSTIEEFRETTYSDHYSQSDFNSILDQENIEYVQTRSEMLGGKDFDSFLSPTQEYMSEGQRILDFRFY